MSWWWWVVAAVFVAMRVAGYLVGHRRRPMAPPKFDADPSRAPRVDTE